MAALSCCGAQAIDILISRLGDDRLADAVVTALTGLGTPAVGRLATLLRTPQAPAVRVRAVTALRGIGAPAMEASVVLLDTADAPGRLRAGGALVALGNKAVPVLVQVLEAGSTHAADAAADLLAEIGDPAPAALLWRGDPAAHVRRRVAKALSGSHFDDARGPLLGLLIDVDAEVRAAAAASLVRHGPDGLDLLVRAAAAEEDSVAETALRALAAAGPDAVGPLLDLAAQHSERAAGPLRAIGTVSALLGLTELGVDPLQLSASTCTTRRFSGPPSSRVASTSATTWPASSDSIELMSRSHRTEKASSGTSPRSAPPRHSRVSRDSTCSRTGASRSTGGLPVRRAQRMPSWRLRIRKFVTRRRCRCRQSGSLDSDRPPWIVMPHPDSLPSTFTPLGCSRSRSAFTVVVARESTPASGLPTDGACGPRLRSTAAQTPAT